MSDAISYFVLVILIDNNTDNKLLVTLIVHLPSNSERGDVRTEDNSDEYDKVNYAGNSSKYKTIQNY